MLGTQWTALGDGNRVAELLHAFSCAEMASEYGRASKIKAWANIRINLNPTPATNLKLTGASISQYDWQRLESEAFKVGA